MKSRTAFKKYIRTGTHHAIAHIFIIPSIPKPYCGAPWHLVMQLPVKHVTAIVSTKKFSFLLLTLRFKYLHNANASTGCSVLQKVEITSHKT